MKKSEYGVIDTVSKLNFLKVIIGTAVRMPFFSRETKYLGVKCQDSQHLPMHIHVIKYGHLLLLKKKKRETATIYFQRVQHKGYCKHGCVCT